MTKLHLNVATGEVAEHKDSSPVDSYTLVLTTEDAGIFSFLTQTAGEKLSGSIVSSLKEREAQAQLVRLVAAQDYSGLRSMVEQRANAQVYRDALARRAELKVEVDHLANELEAARNRSKLVNKAVAKEARFAIRKFSLEFRERFETMRFLWAQLNEYRALTAQAALASSILQERVERADGAFLEFTEKKLNDLEALGEYETNSPEWHAARASGIGGSDVGAILRVDKEWASTNYSRVVNSKLGLDELNGTPLDSWDLRSGIGRGNAWEEYIRQTVAIKHPELRVAFCKTSWHNSKTPYRHANFDGLFLDESGVPEGILEIKTGSDPSKWGPEALGIFGVPAGYRKQVLWYAYNGGLSYGKLVAVLDDNDYREYNFSLDDPRLRAEIEEMISATDAFWVSMQEKRAKLKAGEEIRTRRKRGMKLTNDYDAIADVYAGYAGITPAEAKEQLVTSIEALKVEKGRMLTETEFQRAAVTVFAQHDPSTRQRPLIGVDLETTTTSPRTGRIIETGIARLNSDGKTEVVYSTLHDVPTEALAGVGLGEYDIHRISSDMIVGAPRFDDPKVQHDVLELLKSGTLVAHNASFEDRFFAAHLNGYLEAKEAGEITILDTRKLASFLMTRSDDSSLQSFAEDNGVPYAGAHAATADAVMMMKALGRLQEFLYKNKTFRTKRITDAARVRAQKIAFEADSSR